MVGEHCDQVLLVAGHSMSKAFGERIFRNIHFFRKIHFTPIRKRCVLKIMPSVQALTKYYTVDFTSFRFVDQDLTLSFKRPI